MKVMKKIYIETYGCQMNEYDSELVKALLQKNGFVIVADNKKADIIILNTCAVRDSAVRKVSGRIARLRYLNKNYIIGVIGCIASAYKTELYKIKDFKIDFFVGPDNYKKLAQVIKKVIISNEKSDETEQLLETYEDVFPVRKKGASAWLTIMRGCNNYCTYCIVPYSRGPERSKSFKSIINEVEQIIEQGYKQVYLLGQNVNSYVDNKQNFVDLIKTISNYQQIKRIRFTSPHPKDLSMSLIELMAQKSNICSQLHLPLQSGSTNILEKMNRTYTQEDYLALIKNIKSIIPDIVLSTDIIIGFPGETKKDYEETIKVMKEVMFDSAYIFKYSVRPKTLAAKKYKDNVSEKEKKARITKLNEMQKEISLLKNMEAVDKVQEVMIESISTKKSVHDCYGRNQGNKLIVIPNNNYVIGDEIKVKIWQASANTLRGMPV
jgi:tRNA-2-methylthio-N6-dimethylallyladenosine synthase